MKQVHSSGLIISPIDQRDYNLSKMGVSASASYPEEFEYDLSDLTIQNQLYYNCCVAELLAYEKFIVEHKQTGNKKPFSVGWIYGNRKSTDFLGKGMSIRDALQNLMEDGVPLNDDFPTLSEYPDIMNQVLAVKDKLANKAKPYRISAYANLHAENSIDALKIALAYLGPIAVSIKLIPSVDNVGSNGLIPMPSPDEKSRGYHGICIYGYTKDRFKALNSWGLDYGNLGKMEFPCEYPFVETWSITDNILPTPPAPSIPITVTTYKIYVGNYLFGWWANFIANHYLRKNGINVSVQQISKWHYRIYCGAFINEVDKDKMVKKIKLLGFKNINIETTVKVK